LIQINTAYFEKYQLSPTYTVDRFRSSE